MRVSSLKILTLAICTIGCVLVSASEQIGGLLPPLLQGLASINSVQKLAVQSKDNHVAEAIVRTFDETLLDTEFSIPEDIIKIERDVLLLNNTSWATFESLLLSRLLKPFPQELFSVKIAGKSDTSPFYVMKGKSPVENSNSGNLESASQVLIVQVTERPTSPLPLEVTVGNNQYMLAGLIVKQQGEPLKLVYNAAKTYDDWRGKQANLRDQNLQSGAHILFYVLRDEEVKAVRNLTYDPPVLNMADILDEALEFDADSSDNTDHAIGAGNIGPDFDAPMPEHPNVFRQTRPHPVPHHRPHGNRNPHRDFYAANRNRDLDDRRNAPQDDDPALVIWLSVGLALLMTMSVVLLTSYRRRRALVVKTVDSQTAANPILAPSQVTSAQSVNI